MQFFKNVFEILTNFLINIHKLSISKKQKKTDWTVERKYVSTIIMDVLVGNLCVREALLKFPKNCSDIAISVAWHALLHFEADEDISSRDDVFKDIQVDFLEGLYNILAEGNDLPENLIAGYNKYHEGVETSQVSGREYFWHEMKKNLSL